MHNAYACLDKLIVQQRVEDTEDVYPTRTEVSALVRLVNDELQRCIEAAAATMQSLRALLNTAAAQG